MSGHTFKVGDRVGLVNTEWKDTGIVLAVGERFAWVVWDDNDGEPTTERLASLRLLPLFEPVERWLPVWGNDSLGDDLYDVRPDATVNGCRWVKVLISPAEDQS